MPAELSATPVRIKGVNHAFRYGYLGYIRPKHPLNRGKQPISPVTQGRSGMSGAGLAAVGIHGASG